MKVTVLTDKTGRILSIVTPGARPAKGKAATREEIAAAAKMQVGVQPLDDKEQQVHELELPAEFAKMEALDLHEKARIDMSGKTPRIVRKSK